MQDGGLIRLVSHQVYCLPHILYACAMYFYSYAYHVMFKANFIELI